MGVKRSLCGNGLICSLRISHIYTSVYHYRLEDAVTVSCNENGWNVRVHMSILRQIHPNAVAGDIYMGDNTCTGQDRGYDVIFQQGLRDCLTSEVVSHVKFMNIESL